MAIYEKIVGICLIALLLYGAYIAYMKLIYVQPRDLFGKLLMTLQTIPSESFHYDDRGMYEHRYDHYVEGYSQPIVQNITINKTLFNDNNKYKDALLSVRDAVGYFYPKGHPGVCEKNAVTNWDRLRNLKSALGDVIKRTDIDYKNNPDAVYSIASMGLVYIRSMSYLSNTNSPFVVSVQYSGSSPSLISTKDVFLKRMAGSVISFMNGTVSTGFQPNDIALLDSVKTPLLVNLYKNKVITEGELNSVKDLSRTHTNCQTADCTAINGAVQAVFNSINGNAVITSGDRDMIIEPILLANCIVLGLVKDERGGGSMGGCTM